MSLLAREKDVCITGIGQSEVGRPSIRSAMQLTVDACLEAIADAGLTPDDIDRSERSLWRYASAIRVDMRSKVSLGEGWTLFCQFAISVPVRISLLYLLFFVEILLSFS